MAEEQIAVGGKYEFDMEEVGAVGIADVLSIEECPQSPRRHNEHHRLVTGKFEHEASNVIDLSVVHAGRGCLLQREEARPQEFRGSTRTEMATRNTRSHKEETGNALS